MATNKSLKHDYTPKPKSYRASLFFSRRRRHTRFKCDWSSDVCSSDLPRSEILRESGRLLARFPNGDSPFGRYCQYGDYTHVTTLSSGKLIHLAKVCDFSVVFIGAPSNPIWRGKLRSAVKRLAMAGLRALVDRILRLAYFNGYPVCLDENLLVVLERKLTRP